MSCWKSHRCCGLSVVDLPRRPKQRSHHCRFSFLLAPFQPQCFPEKTFAVLCFVVVKLCWCEGAIFTEFAGQKQKGDFSGDCYFIRPDKHLGAMFWLVKHSHFDRVRICELPVRKAENRGRGMVFGKKAIFFSSSTPSRRS